MTPSDLSYRFNPFLQPPGSPSLGFADRTTARQVAAFHRSLPGYAATPCHRLRNLAAHLGVAEIMIKDESWRFGLNAFKGLGASYAVARVLARRFDLGAEDLTYPRLIQNKARFSDLTFITATDGNHGRAVAWTAHQLGCKSVVLMPRNSSPLRLEAIRRFGSDAWMTDGNYDDTVRQAATLARQNDWILLQDTAWLGYAEIPAYIMQGYFTLITEFLQQARDLWPTHVFLQAGVGSMAAAVLSIFHCFGKAAPPRFIIVEPHGAPCFYLSGGQPDGAPYRVEGDLETIMAGLACGEPSLLAWEIIKAGATAFVSCSDEIARRGMKVLGNPLTGDPAVVSGESGAVTLGLVYELLADSRFGDARRALGLTPDAKVFLLSTEGDTDPVSYRRIVWS